MKIEKNKSKKSVGDLPLVTQELIQSLLSCPEESLTSLLSSVSVWRYGKCELYHWIDVLDKFDAVLSRVTEDASSRDTGSRDQRVIYMCPLLSEEKTKRLVLSVLSFTSLLIEHSYARHIYNSTEHLCILLASPDLDIILAVLNLFYVFGKRSNFISRLPSHQRSSLNSYLEFLGESWGGKQNGFGLAQCCQNLNMSSFPSTATSVYFEYQPTNNNSESSGMESHTVSTRSITVSSVDKYEEDISQIMSQLLVSHSVPLVQQMRLLTRLRLANSFSQFETRVKCVLVRLQAVSVLVYSMAPAEVVDPLIYDGLVEELIEVLEVKNPLLQHEVKAAVLRTLTAIIHLERDPRLGAIIEATGASTYHGFLPTLVRDCVNGIITAGPDGTSEEFPLFFATSLFSFLYHLATYEASGDALVNSGIMESLLLVLEWKATEPMNITLVTRAVRVIDLITNLDMTAFHSLGGWDKMLQRLHEEVTHCKEEVPTTLTSVVRSAAESAEMETEAPPMSLEPVVGGDTAGGITGGLTDSIQCMPERSALVKSILNFVKKAVPDPTFTENIRNFVDSSLPGSLAHIASNAEYYGPSIYLPATEVTTTFIFHDPSQLTPLQDNGLPWVILNSLINKKIPVTREVLSALPSILSAICLNARGLQVFIDAQPFDHLFGVLISSEYLPAMRRKRGSDPLGDTASNLGTAMDELMRHQPLLKSSVMIALVRLLNRLCQMGNNVASGMGGVEGVAKHTHQSDEDIVTSEDEEEELFEEKGEEEEEGGVKTKKRRPSAPPLTEFTLNVVNFVDAILSTSSSDDHINEFIQHDGLKPLLSLLSLPALPLNFTASSACNSITSACKSILNVAHSGKLLTEGLQQLSDVLQKLKSFIDSPQQAKHSKLIKEVNSYTSPEQSQLLHNLSSAGGYIQLFIHLSKCVPVESRQLCIQHWASPLGQEVLSQLSRLYRSLVWEGFIVLAAASANEETTPTSLKEGSTSSSSFEASTRGALFGNREGIGGKDTKLFALTLKSFTPPLVVTSRVGRSLAELMSILVRLATGPLHRPTRRGAGLATPLYVPLSDHALTVSMKVTDLLLESLTWEVPVPMATGGGEGEDDVFSDSDAKKWLFTGMTFKMYAVDFCLLLLFDEHMQPYHLMLHTFSKKNVLESFIQTFYSAMEHIERGRNDAKSSSTIFNPDYAVASDFLEAWLNLAEKLINASAILESSHTLPIPPPPASCRHSKKPTHNPLFNPLDFILKTQNAIFPCIQQLWGTLNLNSLMPVMTEHLLTTIKHIYSSEKLLESKLNKMSGGQTPSSSSSTVLPQTPSVPFLPRADPLHLQQLMDMGFDQLHAEEALLATGNNLPASMEWILTHPHSTVSGDNRVMTEDEQLAQAIALSLQPSVEDKMDEEEKPGVVSISSDSLKPIDRLILTKFSEDLLEGLLTVVPLIEGTVYRACDLITALCQRNGTQWRTSALEKIRNKAMEAMSVVIKKINDSDFEILSGSIDSDAFYLCLLALLMEEMPLVCSSVMCTPSLLSQLVTLLNVAQEKWSDLKRRGGGEGSNTSTAPLWLSPLLLVLELWQGIETLVTWHRPPNKDYSGLWLCFETMNNRWCFYSPDVNKTIENAYKDGEAMARIQSSRQQRSVVQFSNMLQINLDTNTQRPVVRLEVPRKRQDGTSVTCEIPNLSSFKRPDWFVGLSDKQSLTVVKSCTRLLSCNLDPDTLHADMRLLLSLTRRPELAEVFMSEKGPLALLLLTKKSSFQGFSTLSALLIRHILETGSLLETEMESMVRSVVGGANQDPDLKTHGLGRRDLDVVLRRLGPCATRNKELFVGMFCQIAQLSSAPPRIEEYQSSQRLPPIVLKVGGAKSEDSTSLSPLHTNLLNLLLDQLCASTFLEGEESSHTHTKMDEDSLLDGLSIPVVQYGGGGGGGNPRVRRSSYRRQQVTEDDLRSEDMVLDVDHAPERGRQEAPVVHQEEANSKEEEKGREQLLFSQAAILRLLAELIESFPGTSRLIIESTRKIKIRQNSSNSQTTKVMSIIAFILDHLLPVSYTQGSGATQVAKLAKVFLQCLATAPLPTDALSLFVTEFRSAFTRSLLLSESQLKHHRIRAMASLLGQIVEPQAGSSARSTVNPTQFVRVLIRKGFITDLAKAVHSLDLCSPLLTTTINSILKPLECLTKIVSQFVAAQKRVTTGSSNPPPVGVAAVGGATSGATAVNISLEQNEEQQREARPTTQPLPPNPQVVPSTHPPPPVRTPLSMTNNDNIRIDPLCIPLRLSQDQSVPITPLDNSLIPLREDERVREEDEDEEGEDDIADESLVEEAITLAHELGVRCGRMSRHETQGTENILEEIVDELLERRPGHSAASSNAMEIYDNSFPSDSGSILDELLEDEEEEEPEDDDNINSAGEDIEDEFEISQNSTYIQPRRRRGSGGGAYHDNDEDEENIDDRDTSATDEDQTSHDSTVEEEEEEEVEHNPSDNSFLPDAMTIGDTPPDGRGQGDDLVDETFEIDPEEFDGEDEGGEEEEEEEEEDDDDDEEEEEGLELDYDEQDDFYLSRRDNDSMIHVEFPSWNFGGWRETDNFDGHLFPGVHVPASFLSRAYHIRTPLSEGTFPSSSLSSLPRSHPLLVRSRGDNTLLPPSAPPPSVGGAGGVSDATRSNIVQQLLTNISNSVGIDEILSFSIGGGHANDSARQISSSMAPPTTTPTIPSDSPESTYIPSPITRWKEESQALDGHTAHVCIGGLRPLILHKLTENLREREKATHSEAPSSSKTEEPKVTDPEPVPSTREEERPSSEQQVPVPNPSDEATPSTATPRNGSRSVEQLHSSLRAVADALAQTVAEMSNGRYREEGATNEQGSSDIDPLLADLVNRHTGENHVTTASSHVTDQPTPHVTSGDGHVTTSHPTLYGSPSHPRSVTGIPDLSSFDGSQDSARAMLSQINPNDPLYTFLSAVARAPTPPLPESQSEPANLSAAPPIAPPTSSLSSSSSASRLPVFAQLLPSNEQANPLTSPASQSTVVSSSSEATPTTAMASGPASSQIPTSNFADALARELSNRLSPLFTSIAPPFSSADHLATPSSSASPMVTIVPPHLTTMTSVSTGSPSPSDTLAPLMSSLQMPPHSLAPPHTHTQFNPPDLIVPDEEGLVQRVAIRATFVVPPPVRLSSSSSSSEVQSSSAEGGISSSSTLGTGGITSNENTSQTHLMQLEGAPSLSSLNEATTTSVIVSPETTPIITVISNTAPLPPSASSSTEGVAPLQAELPDGIDPTFLAALPDTIRQEVLAQYEREQRNSRRGNASGVGGATSSSVQSINPEILAALPPDIQEEVIQQQRIEQARQSQLQVDPSQPADAMSFFTSLNPELRRTILSEMDDTVISQLPDEIASEARVIRQERENRRRQFLAQHQAHVTSRMIPSWSHAIATAGATGRIGQFRYAILSPGDHHPLGGALHVPQSFTHTFMRDSTESASKQMLDQESLVCLLVLLFLDQSKLHFNRLFRIFRSLSQHLPSRYWVIASLLSIIREAHFTSHSPSLSCPLPPTLTPQQPTSQTSSVTSQSAHAPLWLTVSINAALGSHAPVLQFVGGVGKVTTPTVHIHPHASHSICNNVFELLIFLARQFPVSFLPPALLPSTTDKADDAAPSTNEVVSNFWQILFKLDSSATPTGSTPSHRKGKYSTKTFQYMQEKSDDMKESDLFSGAPIGQLMSLFSHPVIQGSVSLVDKLLRVLSVISGAIPKHGLSRRIKASKDGNGKGSSAVAVTTEAPPVTMTTDAPVSTAAAMVTKVPPPSLVTPMTPSCYSSSIVSISLLKGTIRLLTSGKCSEDTLDDATSLLINLSRCGQSTRQCILLILLEGINDIGHNLHSQIHTLLTELNSMMPLVMRRQASNDEEATPTSGSGGAGSLGTVEGVVLPTVGGGRGVVDHSSDLHLPCMEPLVSKGSQQSFFLRLLKVVCQLRDSVAATSVLESLHAPRHEATGRSGLIPPDPLSSSLGATRGEGPDNQSSSPQVQDDSKSDSLPPLSSQLDLEKLWSILSDCLDALASTYDPHAVLALQPTVEAFFLVHADHTESCSSNTRLTGGVRAQHSSTASRRLPSFHTISDTESIPGSPAPSASHLSPVPSTPLPTDLTDDPYSHLPPETARFLKFAERHRTVLNQILRQTTVPLSEGPFSVLVNHTRLLDFDVKRRYFRQELEQMEEGLRRDELVIHIRRSHVFEDSYRELYRRSPDELKANLYITFDGEEGQDAGGLLREWYLIIAREMFNPNYALFKTTPGDRVTYMPNPSSHINPEHLNYFKFVGRIIAKAVYDNKLLDCYFTRSFYKHILGKPVHYTDMESEDYAFYQGMVYLLEHDIDELGLDLTFSVEIEEFGKTETKDLKPNGRELMVTEANKREYVQLACQMKMTGSVKSQIKSFLEGFYDVIPKTLISIFNEQELELLISGLPSIDIDDLKANTEYHKYTESSLQVQWFWRALRSCSQSDRARFLQFVTGTSKVPLQGFAALEGMNGIQKFQIHKDDRSTDRLPSAHTCFNQLDLPPYETYDKLQEMLLIAIRECPEGFGFA